MKKNTLSSLSALVADLDEEKALNLTHRLIGMSEDPLTIINHANQGMVEVGRRYEEGRYFISALIMAGEIMQQIGQMVVPLMAEKPLRQEVGKIVIGTVEGDIHFIGKDIFKAMVRAHGFTVHDLGVDVPMSRFMVAIQDFNPDIVGFSCMISTGMDTMRATIAHLRANLPPDLAPKAYLAGGQCVDRKNGRLVGADLWASDSMEGVRLCQRILMPSPSETSAVR
jgi:methanogenic corrinoid protein MtbC1